MSEAVNRSYPITEDAQLDLAASVIGVDKNQLVRGVHLGHAQPNGVALPDDPTFSEMLPIHRVDNPADGWNDGAKYVVYFQKDVGGDLHFYKATNADPSTITELTAGPEYQIALERQQ